MKKNILILSAGVLIIFGAQITQAQDRDIAIGAIINDPTGFSVKGWVDASVAIDGAASFFLTDNFSSIYLHSDVLFHSDVTDEKFGVDDSNVDLYYGLGMRLFFVDDSDPQAGIRFPGGIAYQIDETALELFFEIVPLIDFAPDGAFQIDGAVGARFYLN